MLIGVIAGILTIIIQPFAYLFTRIYTMRGGPVLELLIYSHIIMGALSGIILVFYLHDLEFTSTLQLRLLGCVITFLVGQGCYFFTARLMEPSRLTTLLGLKLIFLVFLNMLFFSLVLAPGHWTAIILCIAAAFVMNHSGGRLTLKAFGALLLCCLFLAGSDIMDMLLVSAMPYESVISRGIAATALCYFSLGIVIAPALFFVKFDHKKLVSALPYSISWLAAMILLFICFGTLGTVFANILQSGRVLVQVLLGSCVAYLGYAAIEPKALKHQWLCRGLAACMIIAAVAIYAFLSNSAH